MTILNEARKGLMPQEIQRAAALENIPPETLRDAVATGKVAVPCNRNRWTEP